MLPVYGFKNDLLTGAVEKIGEISYTYIRNMIKSCGKTSKMNFHVGYTIDLNKFRKHT